jgi:hypothetical protein
MGGVYSTPGPAGSKSGAPIAGAWYAMMTQGYNGFFTIKLGTKKAQAKY